MSKKHTGTYKKGKKWYAKITFNKVTHYLGNFKTEKEAGQAYEKAKNLLFNQKTEEKSNQIEKISGRKNNKKPKAEQLKLF